MQLSLAKLSVPVGSTGRGVCADSLRLEAELTEPLNHASQARAVAVYVGAGRDERRVAGPGMQGPDEFDLILRHGVGGEIDGQLGAVDPAVEGPVEDLLRKTSTSPGTVSVAHPGSSGPLGPNGRKLGSKYCLLRGFRSSTNGGTCDPGMMRRQPLCAIAAEHGLTLCVGLSEKENDLVFNAQIVVGPDGYVGKQRKIHLSRDEILYYKGGRDLPVFDIGPCKVGIQICYDKQFPEISRILCLRGAELLLMPHAAREIIWDETAESQRAARQHMARYYRKIIPTRAIENSCFTALTDQVGRAGYVDLYPRDSPSQPHHPGAALIVDPSGEIIAEASDERIEPEMIVATLEAAAINRERAKPNFALKTRRPELFGELVAEQVRC